MREFGGVVHVSVDGPDSTVDEETVSNICRFIFTPVFTEVKLKNQLPQHSTYVVKDGGTFDRGEDGGWVRVYAWYYCDEEDTVLDRTHFLTEGVYLDRPDIV